MNFKRMRLKTGLTQQDVAQRLNISNTTVSMWETGESLPRAELLTKIAKLYDCTIDELLTHDENEAEDIA